MILGVIGPRDVNGKLFENYDFISKHLLNYKDCKKIISGGGKGIETLVEQFAANNSIDFHKVVPRHREYGDAAFVIRNQKIIEDSDVFIVFWNGFSSNLNNDILKSLKKGSSVHIIPVNG